MLNFKKMKTTLNKVGKSGLVIGVGSVLNIYPVYSKPDAKIYFHPDTQVLKSDWKSIGKDFKQAIEKVK